MRRLLLISLASLALPLIYATSTSAQSGTKPIDAIQAADQAWMKVFAAEDLDKSVAFFSESGSMLSANSPIAAGHEAISRQLTGFFNLPHLKISWSPNRADVAQSGELGYTSGVYEMSFSDASGKTISDTGKYVTVWKKQADGSWKVALDIFNSDNPPGM